MNINIKENIPKNVKMISAMLKHAGFEAYLVGGCVRDHVMGIEPSDYDFATNATPEQIISLFPRTFYENVYGTVGVVTITDEDAKNVLKGRFLKRETKNNDNDLKKRVESVTQETMEGYISNNLTNVLKENIVEITPYRLESNYSDGRRPDNVTWSQDILDDLKRRDFTCNAMAYDMNEDILIDEFGGVEDINNKTLKAVGDADKRFKEDALRIIRAVRFCGKFDFKIEKVTREMLINNTILLKNISQERIRDEFSKILMSNNPKSTLELAHELGVLKYISREVENGIGIEQNQAHKYDVWEHNLRTLQHAADKGWSLELRLSAILHDVSKPETRRYSKEKRDYTFYGHDVVGGRVAREILSRLKYPKETINYVSDMVRWHMFFSDTEKVSLSAVRRLVNNIGKENIWDLVNLRICDRVGTGRPKEEPYRFRKYQSMIQQALVDPISLKQLKIDGLHIMSVTQETPGPKIGMILNALFAEVLDDPIKNNVDYLETRAKELVTQETETLKLLADKGKLGIEKENAGQLTSIRKDFRVN